MNSNQNYSGSGKPTSGAPTPTKGQHDGSGENDAQMSGTNNIGKGAEHGNTTNGDRMSDDGRRTDAA